MTHDSIMTGTSRVNTRFYFWASSQFVTSL